MPLYVIDDEYFVKQYSPAFFSSPEAAEACCRRMFARILARTTQTLWSPSDDLSRREFRSKVASILRRGLRVKEFHGA